MYYDPLKLISKLGAKHIKDWEHLEEFRRSLCDVAVSQQLLECRLTKDIA